MEDQNLNQAIQNQEVVQAPEIKQKSNYALFLTAGFVVLLTLGLLTIGYSYLSNGSKAPGYTTTVGQEEQQNLETPTSQVIVKSDRDLETLDKEIDSTDTKDLETDYEQALSEASEL